ncbi:hypothetical protein MspRI1_23720 [Marinobacter sp. RI1]
MAGEKRTWVRQAFMKRSFMRRRTPAIYDCWLDPLAGACSGFWEGVPESDLCTNVESTHQLEQQLWTQTP